MPLGSERGGATLREQAQGFCRCLRDRMKPTSHLPRDLPLPNAGSTRARHVYCQHIRRIHTHRQQERPNRAYLRLGRISDAAKKNPRRSDERRGLQPCMFQKKLALRELRTLTSLLQAVLLTLDHTRVAGEVAGLLELGAIVAGVE